MKQTFKLATFHLRTQSGPLKFLGVTPTLFLSFLECVIFSILFYRSKTPQTLENSLKSNSDDSIGDTERWVGC